MSCGSAPVTGETRSIDFPAISGTFDQTLGGGGPCFIQVPPDIAAQYGARFGLSGWELAWDTTGLAPGVHRLYLYAHRTTDNAWSPMEPYLVVVPGGPARWLPIVSRRR